MAVFTNRPLTADTTLNGVGVYLGDDRVGTVWHSNFWGWQWARWTFPGWIGGECASKDDGLKFVENACEP